MQPPILTPEPLGMAHWLAKDWNLSTKMPPQVHLPLDLVGSSYAPALDNRTGVFHQQGLQKLSISILMGSGVSSAQNKPLCSRLINVSQKIFIVPHQSLTMSRPRGRFALGNSTNLLFEIRICLRSMNFAERKSVI